NMAHGEFIMIGAYVAYLFQQTFAGVLGGVELGIWFVLALPAAFLVAAALGALMEVSLVRYLYGRPLDTLLATWGVGLILQQAARSIFGAPNVNVSSPTWLSGGVDIGAGLLLPYKRIFIIVLVVVVVAAVYYYLYRTINGRRLRAVMQNREMASCLGVRSRWVDAGTFALGTGLAGVAGVALTQLGSIGPALGTFYIVDAFMVVVLGGVGRLPGTILAALLIGVMNTVLELGTSATVGKVLVLLLIIAFLQWKPSGLAALQTR
ncbi:MAG: urea ABC transporter permease subunit UrtB, partial [Caldilineaceae bacterium]|nr:urea ABC transporter permease subunit UrtB [Caldilineaceae bacterium]